MRKPYCIAEAGVNHNGSLKRAHELVDAAADAGADAVKFQAFHTELMQGRNMENLVMLYPLEPGKHWWKHLGAHVWERGLDFIVTPFDLKSLDEIQNQWLTSIKIASSEITNRELLRNIFASGFPCIMSTGRATDTEVGRAFMQMTLFPVRAMLMYCVPDYPTEVDRLDLSRIRKMREFWSTPVGFSDHCDSVETGATAVKHGAEVLEKHFTLSRKLPGPDHFFSLEPDMLKQYIAKAKDEYVAGQTAKSSDHLGSVAGRSDDGPGEVAGVGPQEPASVR